jgi:RNA polymerase subunit RPABC4/transcription elongation factor Spt4
MAPQETLSFPRQQTSADIAAGERVCPVCSRETTDEYVPLRSLPEKLARLIRANAPGSSAAEEACERCVELFKNAREHIVKDAAMAKDGSPHRRLPQPAGRR